MEIRGISSIPVNRTAASTSGAAAATGQPEPATGAAEAKSSGSGVSAAGYISPFLRYDQSARVAVLYFRDVDTGETQSQIPSAKAVEEYRKAAGRLASRDEKPASTGNSGGRSSDAGQAGAGVADSSYSSTGNSGSGSASAADFGYAVSASAGSYPAGGGSSDSSGAGSSGFAPTPSSGGGSSSSGSGPFGSGGLVSVTV